LIAANVIAISGFIFLALASPPALPIWRFAGVLGIGFGAGLLNAALFQVISPLYQHDRASTINLAGALFGLGCMLAALLVAGTFYLYSAPRILVLFAVLPALSSGLCFKLRDTPDRSMHAVALSAALEDVRKPAAVLFSMVLFFQFANEWTIAGWLPLFLI